MKPMLSGKIESIDEVRFPVYCTPKLDGIRCLIVDGVAVSRKLKPIPNAYIRDWLVGVPNGLDGELMLRGAKNFGEVSSAVMGREGKPDFEFCVFDLIDPNEPYLKRVEAAELLVFGEQLKRNDDRIKLLTPAPIMDAAALAQYETWALGEGYEGVMLRSADGPYKFGRSTVREGHLLKLKRFEDAEATVIGYEELLRNENELGKDELGHAKRSKAKAGMVPGGTLGKLLVRRADGVEFAIGSGFDDAGRAKAWAERDSLAGRLVKYKHLPHGAQEAPRHPIFLGFRHEDDV